MEVVYEKSPSIDSGGGRFKCRRFIGRERNGNCDPPDSRER
jgi:hypothetical protein